MKTFCKDYLSKNHSKIDLAENISCCLFLLIEKYNEANNNSSRKEFSKFLLNSLNYYLKDRNYKIKKFTDLFLNKEQISISIFSKFLNILIHYSAIFIYMKKAEFAKFILSLGVDLINKSEFKNEKQIIKKKIALANNISCVYLISNNFIKAELFLEKCKEKVQSSLNKLIIYNNSCIIIIKKLKLFENNNDEKAKIVENILHYLNMIFNDINKRRENKFQSSLSNKNDMNEKKKFILNHKNELFCFLIYNCFKIMKIFIKKEFDKNFSDALIFIQNLLGNHHFIALNMKRLEEKNNNSEFINLLLNENFNDPDNNYANKDIISYIKKDDNQKNKEKNILEIEKGIKLEIKRIYSKKEKYNEKTESKINNEKNINNKTPIINTEEKKEENTNKISKDLDINDKTKPIEESKKNPKLMGQKKTWKGLFQIITGKKFQGQENKFSELFKSITKSKNETLKKLENIKSQYNEYHEEMVSYLKDKIPDNYITFNKDYSSKCPEELIICVIDENDEEKNNFDKIAFEKSLQKEIQIKHNSNFIINYFKNSIRKQIIFPDLISDILDYDILEKMNNLYSSKKKNELSINKEIERIINNNKIELKDEKNNQLNQEKADNKSFDKNKAMTNNKIETEFYLDTDKYKILYINDIENKKILIHATKAKSNQSKKESFEEPNQFYEIKSQISYDDINYYYSKYYFNKQYEFCIYLRYMQDINYFIQRILVHYIRLIKIKDEPKLVFCKYPKGNFKRINRKGRPEFTFLNEQCTFELCKYSKNFELNIYNLTFTSNLKIILELDYSSESVFFQEKTEKKKSKNNLKLSADFEYNSNYKIFTRFANFFIKLEKICKFRDKTIKTFSEYAEKYKSNIHKFTSTDSMINMDLWIISLQEIETKNKEIKEIKVNDIINNIKLNSNKIEFQWNVELYSLTKLAIKNGSFYMYKNIILTRLDFENILGCDYSDIYTIIDDRDNFHCLYFLLGTIQKMKHILIKMLNSGNYLTAFRLQKINPISFFKHKFVFKHIKRYFICSLEFLIYTRESFFLRIMVTESITNRSYSKIFIPIYTIKFEFDIKEMEKFLKQKYEAITSLYQNKKNLKKFLLEESRNLLTKNSSDGPDALVLFENIEFLVDRIKVFFAENPI